MGWEAIESLNARWSLFAAEVRGVILMRITLFRDGRIRKTFIFQVCKFTPARSERLFAVSTLVHVPLHPFSTVLQFEIRVKAVFADELTKKIVRIHFVINVCYRQ